MQANKHTSWDRYWPNIHLSKATDTSLTTLMLGYVIDNYKLYTCCPVWHLRQQQQPARYCTGRLQIHKICSSVRLLQLTAKWCTHSVAIGAAHMIMIHTLKLQVSTFSNQPNEPLPPLSRQIAVAQPHT